MLRLSIATPLRSLRAAAARPSAATRFAAPAVAQQAFHLSARSTAPAAADAVKSAGAPALNTTGQPVTDPMTGEVTKNADIDVSPRVCPFDGRKVEGETACRSSPGVAAEGAAMALKVAGVRVGEIGLGLEYGEVYHRQEREDGGNYLSAIRDGIARRGDTQSGTSRARES